MSAAAMNITLGAVASAISEHSPDADSNGNPWSMPGHSPGETFATWAIFAAVAGLIMGAMIIDFCRKQRGHEMITQRIFRKTWNFTFGRIDSLQIQGPDVYSEMEKGKAKEHGKVTAGNDSSSDEENPKTAPPKPEITLTQPVAKIDSKPVFETNSFPGGSLAPFRASEDRPGSSWGSMLDPTSDGAAGGEFERRRASYASTISQHSGERRVAQPLPGRMLTGRQI